jgi:hypothetical protein
VSVLPSAPASVRPFPEGLVGAGQEPGVGRGKVAATLGIGYQFDEAVPFPEENPTHISGNPLRLAPSPRGHGGQHHAGYPFRMSFA